MPHPPTFSQVVAPLLCIATGKATQKAQERRLLDTRGIDVWVARDYRVYYKNLYFEGLTYVETSVATGPVYGSCLQFKLAVFKDFAQSLHEVFTFKQDLLISNKREYTYIL